MSWRQFEPARVFFEEKALEYDLGRQLFDHFSGGGREVKVIGSHNRVTGVPGRSAAEKFREAKKTLVVGVRKGLDFASCRPSADFQLVFSTSCPGMCRYCYLHTTLGRQPVVRLYVNIDEILAAAEEVIWQRQPALTTFEGAATSDPLPLERYCGALAGAISFFAGQKFGRFRFVTKFTAVDSLLSLDHGNHTTVRFSVNTPEIISRYEHNTPPLEERLAAAAKVFSSGYPAGFLIAPVFLTPNWQEAYGALLARIKEALPGEAEPSFEIITHRFTARGKANIAAIFPDSDLPLAEEERRFKYGQFGYGKYIYRPDDMKEAEEFFISRLAEIFPAAKMLYFV